MQLTEEILRKQLKNAGLVEFEILEIELTPNDIDANGKPFLERDRLIMVYRSRLKGTKMNAPDSPLVDYLESSLKLLKSLPANEHIFTWRAECDGKIKRGRSTPQRLININPIDS